MPRDTCLEATDPRLSATYYVIPSAMETICVLDLAQIIPGRVHARRICIGEMREVHPSKNLYAFNQFTYNCELGLSLRLVNSLY